MQSSIYIVSLPGCAEELRDLDLPTEVISFDEGMFRNATGVVPADKAYVHTLCHMRVRDGSDSLAAAWKSQFGSDLPRTVDLSQTPKELRRARALEAIVAMMNDERKALAERNTRLMRELGQMRRLHEQTQFAAQRLEALFYNTVRGERQHDFTLAPVVGHHPIRLHDGAGLEQQLPGRSVGLSDIALLGVQADPEGVLTVSLRALEEPDVIAVWDVPGAKLMDGWVRLSLDRALGGDQLSLMVSMQWRGRTTLELGASVAHPETRFLPHLDGQAQPAVLAMQGWRYIAGNEAPLPIGAVLQSGGKDRLRRIQPEDLKKALNLATLVADVPFIEEEKALQVHVRAEATATAVLRGVALAGARQIFCNIHTRHANSSPTEYALALHDRRNRSMQPDHLPDFAPQLHSGWVKIKGGAKSQLHVMLDAPLDRDCDLYLMTRLPQGEKRTDFGWSSFSDICARF